MKNFILITFTILALVVLSVFLFQSFKNKPGEINAHYAAPDTLIDKPEAGETPDLSQVLKTENMASPVFTVKVPQEASFAGEQVPLEIFYVREYFDRELTVNTYFHSSTILLLKRSSRWFPIIEPILAANNIPNDFKYLALIESGLQNVTSPAGAKGFWQFLRHTAREHGLEVNNDIDERYNVEKSTMAACSYLNEAYEKHRDWTLVAAAYNAGNRRITEELERQKVGSYYNLLLNDETARYVFRILAIKTIFENPEKYGFYPSDMELYPPIQTETITVNETVKDLIDFARDHKINYKTLKYFNPWLLKDHLPNRSRRIYEIKIPLNNAIYEKENLNAEK